MDKSNIKKSANKIMDEAKSIKDEVEDKVVETRGDPVVRMK